VESTNKVIEGILTKTVDSHRRNCVDKLPEVLWESRTTWRNTTGFSPYELVYGKNHISHRVRDKDTLNSATSELGFGYSIEAMVESAK